MNQRGPIKYTAALTVRSYYRLSNIRKVFFIFPRCRFMYYTWTTGVFCVLPMKKDWQRRLARMKRAQHFNHKKRGWTQFDHFRKKRGPHIWRWDVSIRLRCTWTSVSFFFSYCFLFFFPGLAFGPAYHGHLNPVGPSGVGGLLIVTAIQGECFDVFFCLFFDLQFSFYCAFFIFCVFLVFSLIFVFVQTHSKVCEW